MFLNNKRSQIKVALAGHEKYLDILNLIKTLRKCIVKYRPLWIMCMI